MLERLGGGLVAGCGRSGDRLAGGEPAGGSCQCVREGEGFHTPDEIRSFDFGGVDLLSIGGSEIGRLSLEPGWRWSSHVKRLADTQLCEAPHFQYHVQGTLHIQMADGTEIDAGTGDVTAFPHGHDAWVVGSEPVVEQ